MWYHPTNTPSTLSRKLDDNIQTIKINVFILRMINGASNKNDKIGNGEWSGGKSVNNSSLSIETKSIYLISVEKPASAHCSIKTKIIQYILFGGTMIEMEHNFKHSERIKWREIKIFKVIVETRNASGFIYLSFEQIQHRRKRRCKTENATASG